MERKELPGLDCPKGVKKGCHPFAIAEGKYEDAIVLVHGFTGSPGDFKKMASCYKDFSIYVPLLAGHGTQPKDLYDLEFQDFFQPLTALVAELLHRHRHVHLVGLSYGAILATELALAYPIHSLALLAPAFFLSPQTEFHLKMTRYLGLARFLKTRKKANKGRRRPGSPYSYLEMPLVPACSLHKRAVQTRRRVSELGVEVLHIHGDADLTTPLEKNRNFLQANCLQYQFFLIEKGAHVLPFGPRFGDIVNHHVAWLKKVVT